MAVAGLARGRLGRTDPSAKELAELKAKDYGPIEVPASNLQAKDTSVYMITLMPLYWGFDLGLNVPEEDMYKMLKVIETHADELAKLDPSFRTKIAGGHFAAFEHQALVSTRNLVPIHPGLAKFLKEKGQWDSKVGHQHRQSQLVKLDLFTEPEPRRAHICARLA